MLGPVLEELAKEETDVTFLKVNVIIILQLLDVSLSIQFQQ